MDITVAYFHPLLHAEVVKHDFEQIRAMGAGSIVYAVHEQEAQRWPRDLERGLRQAQDAGLKVYLSLGRYGNLFAGPLGVPSLYTFHHPKSRVMDRHGRYHDISCFNHQSFRAWLFKEIEHYLRQRSGKAETLRRTIEGTQPDRTALRAQLASRMAQEDSDHAPAPQ